MTRKTKWKYTLPLTLAIGFAYGPYALADIFDGTRPDVIIDQSVLDQLGPPSNLPGLFLQQPSVGPEKITLIPPHGRRQSRRKHHMAQTAPAAPETATVHLHPIRPHPSHGTDSAAAKPRAKAPAAAKASDPISLSPTAATAPADSASITTETLKAPESSKPPILSIVPTPSVAQPASSAPPPGSPPIASPPGGAASPLMALTAQPANAEPSLPSREAVDSIEFDKESARLPEGAKDILTHLASRMSEDATLDVQLVAYASGDEENASKARKLSLSRAVAVRSFLIDQGVRTTRIDVRALGNKVPDGRPDRVDLMVQKRG